ncbi:MAG: thioredoxin-disulfide reductase [Chloroflexota bacterium]
MDKNNYDVIIIGAGPAGLTAGLYTARARLRSLMIEKGIMGGQITSAEMVENYPGFPQGISGLELTELMQKQATKYQLETMMAEVTAVTLTDSIKKVITTDGDFTAKALIIAGGSARSKLGIPGEEEFTGRGVSYCATCDAAFFQDKAVAVVGGGNVAVTEALHLTHFARKVTIIHRRDRLRAGPLLQEKAFGEPKIEVRWNSVVAEIKGNGTVSGLSVRDVKDGSTSLLPIDGVFISIGLKPETNYLKDILKLDEAGHIITSEKMETELPGVFAAGDIRHNSARQVICAAGDGATAAIYAERYILG